MGGRVEPRRRFERFDNLPAFCVRRVGDAEADGDRAAAEAALDAWRDPGDLVGRRRAMRGGTARQEGAGILHHGHPHRDVADADAVVDDRLSLACRVPPVDVARSNFKLHRGRDAIHGFQRVDGRIDVGQRVLVQIDETGRDDHAGRVQRRAPAEPLRADGADHAVADADVPDRVQVRLRIDHAAVADDDVVCVLRLVSFDDAKDAEREKRRHEQPVSAPSGRLHAMIL